MDTPWTLTATEEQSCPTRRLFQRGSKLCNCMALLLSHFPHPSPSPSISSHLSRSKRSRFSPCSTRAASSSSPSSMESQSSRLTEFPYASPPVRSLMADLVSTVESRLSSDLLPCTLPLDVQSYRNPTGSAEASLLVRSGAPSSPIDFMLGSWLHCKLPTGAALNITSLSCYMHHLTDAPHFLFEIIQSSDTSLVLILDLVPRKDLVRHPDYLKFFYEDTELDKQRQVIYTIPEVQPYISSSLYIRSALSPTAIPVRIETKDAAEAESRLDEIVASSVDPVVKHVLGVWLDCVEGVKRDVTEEEGKRLKERDGVFKNSTIVIDLGSSLPRMFGQETASRVLDALKVYFRT